MAKKINKILIAGASSDIGVELTKKLLKLNYEVIGIYNNHAAQLHKLKLSYKKLKIYKINFEFDEINNYNFEKIDCYLSLQGYLSNTNIKKFNEDELIKHIKINFIKNLIIINKILPHMKKNKFGKIFLTSSVGTKFGGSENTLYYSISKFLNEFHPSYLRKLIMKNISLNTLMIGLVDTKLHNKIISKDLKKRINLTPAKRLISIDEISSTIVDLIINEDNIISNEIIKVTNGE